MPDPKDNAKATGDIHPPETEDAAQQRPRGQPATEGASGTAERESMERDLDHEGRAGKGENQAGFLKEKDGQPGRNT
jgi:hypothetical protein